MIDKLDTHESRPLAIVEKLNELIEAYNSHYHESLDTHHNTTSPKQSTSNDETS
jgi:hypothetical protein